MLYKKSKEVFNEELFKNPTSEYRAAPAVYDGKTIEPFKYIVVKK